jgi:hypothetical protein
MEHTITIKGSGSLDHIVKSLETTLKAIKGLKDADDMVGNGGVNASFKGNNFETTIHKKR